MQKIILLFFSGAVASAALFVACSDDAPGADAAGVCECPAAEPPLAGRLIQVESDPLTIAAGTGDAVSASCPEGAIVLNGSCHHEPVPDASTFLIGGGASRGSGAGWDCEWVNTRTEGDVTVRAYATCLMPAN